MARMQVKVKKLPNFKGELPAYETAHASGFDFKACLDAPIRIKPGERAMLPTGLSFEIPPGDELQVRPRSGWAAKRGLTVVNSPGTVDADYRGEVKIALVNLGQEEWEIVDQDRIAQGVVCPVLYVELLEVSELSETARGAGGFGSTGFQALS